MMWPWGMGSNPPPHFCQDGAQDFLKINEKIGGAGVVANLQRSGGCGEAFSFMPPLL